MNRILILAYGVICYGIFFAVFLYLIGFNADMLVPKSVSSGTPGAVMPAILTNLGLIVLFGVQHTVMARPGFKRALTQWLPVPMERSTYVMATNIVLILIMMFWQPLPGVVWSIESESAALSIHALAGLGWVIVLISTFLTNHFDLFGLRQVYLNAAKKTYTPVGFREILLYRWIRHPMMLGLLIAFWAIPVMTMSHLLFSLGMTLYIIVGIYFEERGLRAELGQDYIDYQQRTRRVLPFY
tara:strand:- start:5709 stop:6431 length:723 start_codon:yes stop_codon:yes gene_type:complete